MAKEYQAVRGRFANYRDGPIVEKETAAQAGTLNGGGIGKASSNSEVGRYSVAPIKTSGLVPADPEADATPIATTWRIGDAFQERAGGYVHTYRLTAIAPHTTRQGHPSLLLYWKGTCAVCGGVLVALSGRRPHELVRTCLAHRGQWTGRKTRGGA